MNQLAVIVQASGLEKTKAQTLLDEFSGYFEMAAEWEAKAKNIKVTDASQRADIAMARVGRLLMKEKRIAVEQTRKTLKEQSLREGKAIDGIANVLKALIIPIETYLDEQEHFVEIQEKYKAEDDRIEAERKAELESIAQKKAEEAERVRILAENERLKKEAEEKERELAAERAKAAAERVEAERKVAEAEAEHAEARQKQKDAQAKYDAERLAIEEKAEAERVEAERKAKDAQEKADLNEHFEGDAKFIMEALRKTMAEKVTA